MNPRLNAPKRRRALLGLAGAFASFAILLPQGAMASAFVAPPPGRITTYGGYYVCQTTKDYIVYCDNRAAAYASFRSWYLTMAPVPTEGGKFPGQCASLVQRYLYEVWGMHVTSHDGKDYASGAVGGNELYNRGFRWSTDGNYQPGDILVFGAKKGNVHGHVAIADGGGNMFDANHGVNLGDSIDAVASESNYLGYWHMPNPPVINRHAV